MPFLSALSDSFKGFLSLSKKITQSSRQYSFQLSSNFSNLNSGSSWFNCLYNFYYKNWYKPNGSLKQTSIFLFPIVLKWYNLLVLCKDLRKIIYLIKNILLLISIKGIAWYIVHNAVMKIEK